MKQGTGDKEPRPPRRVWIAVVDFQGGVVSKVGKLTIVTSWAVDEIAKFKPASPQEMCSFSADLTKKIHCKGVGGKDCN